jgi:hypothetical protein
MIRFPPSISLILIRRSFSKSLDTIGIRLIGLYDVTSCVGIPTSLFELSSVV